MHALLRISAISVIALSASAAFAVTPGEPASNEMIARSQFSIGDTARLQRALAKARRGEKVVVATIGGSITQGAAATTPEKRWANLVGKWWQDRFPKTQIEFVNAGIGATGSNIGSHRAKDHLLKYKPDFVVVEYGVNDPNNELAAETLEGLVRQILKQPNKPAVMLLFMMHPNGDNAQEQHSRIGRHYNLPMVSFRDAFHTEFQSGRLTWQQVLPDGIHPNDWGHAVCASFVGAMLDKVLAALPVDSKLPSIKRVPKPLISDVFERTAMLNASNTKPVSENGWSPAEAWMFGPCWEATEPGSAMEFEVEGTDISVMYFRIKGDMGMAEAQVDGLPPVKLNAWFEADWGGYSNCDLVARNLAPGKHRLRIRVLHETAPLSHGHKFQLQAVMVAGQ